MAILSAPAPRVKPDVFLFDPDAPPAQYVARVGGDAIDAGGPLAPFLDAFLRAFELDDEDVVVWLEREGRAPRVVCVVRPGPAGVNVVTWL